MTENSDLNTNPVTKAVEANQQAELALTKEEPVVALAQAWAAVAANWAMMVDPRSPMVRRMSMPPRRN